MGDIPKKIELLTSEILLFRLPNTKIVYTRIVHCTYILYVFILTNVPSSLCVVSFFLLLLEEGNIVLISN